ncbi:hypothetical protein HKX42_10210 [Salinisphaera sp. USBA-960]|uniref:hypothetical protein n=1 Tax=Salinisphaera orenii TaxID=856731 RepID=UPI000DBE112B|nr:hypothetical protein [Salifodinibacter halophilus]NNC27247.1 hypothetical protein [Salifodinibacter halophilus]
MIDDATQTDADGLSPAAYHATVGPALKATAEVAAKRGYPTLHDDLPCMIALIELVTRLADLYTENNQASAEHDKLAAAPQGAAIMVLREADLDAASIEVMTNALAAADTRVREQMVIGDPRPTVAMAWSYLNDNERDAADRYLQRSVLAIAQAIDAWEQTASQ